MASCLFFQFSETTKWSNYNIVPPPFIKKKKKRIPPPVHMASRKWVPFYGLRGKILTRSIKANQHHGRTIWWDGLWSLFAHINFVQIFLKKKKYISCKKNTKVPSHWMFHEISGTRKNKKVGPKNRGTRERDFSFLLCVINY